MSQPVSQPSSAASVERIFHAWDEALGAKDLDAAIALYQPDATLESPLVCHLLSTGRGIVRGHAELRLFVAQVFAHQPPERKRFRAGYLSDGTRLIWEYPRESPDGEQLDLVEMMEVRDGLIQHHRVYWGWYGLAMLRDGRHP